MAYTRNYMERMLALLAKALSKLLGLKEEGKYPEIKQEVNDLLKEHMKLDAENIMQLPDEELFLHLEKLTGLRPAEIELFADILTQYAEAEENTDGSKAKIAYRKVLLFYEFVSKKERSYSFQREEKVKLLRERIDALPI